MPFKTTYSSVTDAWFLLMGHYWKDEACLKHLDDLATKFPSPARLHHWSLSRHLALEAQPRTVEGLDAYWHAVQDLAHEWGLRPVVEDSNWLGYYAVHQLGYRRVWNPLWGKKGYEGLLSNIGWWPMLDPLHIEWDFTLTRERMVALAAEWWDRCKDEVQQSARNAPSTPPLPKVRRYGYEVPAEPYRWADTRHRLAGHVSWLYQRIALKKPPRYIMNDFNKQGAKFQGGQDRIEEAVRSLARQLGIRLPRNRGLSIRRM